ncbi:MAG: signal peptidase I, partial [Sulfuritalea sp.]|nr:signal peptidase I [Sulfuritalea sp.]
MTAAARPAVLLGLGVAIAAYLLSFFHRVAPAAISGDLQVSFAIGGAQLGTLAATYFYVYTLMQIPTGVLADTLGPRRILWWGGLVAGVGAILFGLAPSFELAFVGRTLVGLGVRPLIVRSGSMEPSISTGALALAQERPASRVQVGDVVSVPTEAGVRVTHRVVAVDRDGRGVKLTLQGDANDVPDAEPYLVTTVDRVVADVPLAGYVVAWGAGPVGRFLLGAFMGVVLLLGVGGRNRLAPAEVTPPPAHAVTRAPTPPTPVGRLRRRVRRTLRWTARLSAATCVTIGAVVTPA